MTYTLILQIVDLAMIGMFAVLIAGLISANGRLRAMTWMLACIGIEVAFAGVALFWARGDLVFLVLWCCGRGIEAFGIIYYLYRSRQPW